MAKAGQVVNRALSLILVQPDEAAIQPSESKAAIEVLNDMMAEWDMNGISIGYSVVTSLSNDLTVPDYALAAMKSNLAVRLAPEFDGNASGLLVTLADRQHSALLNATLTIGPSPMPCTVPVGSGNSGNWGSQGNWNRFYPCSDAEILGENGGTILLEE